ncbi:hypothetical protein LCGC14_0526120 [marine sediment metagenome]|uniref:Uncharacterized protein n=1 Tax=marine sediment metagenome TaxID=412755 RepID=A0A0F9SFC4_9ZZZZ
MEQLEFKVDSECDKCGKAMLKEFKQFNSEFMCDDCHDACCTVARLSPARQHAFHKRLDEWAKNYVFFPEKENREMFDD